MRWCGSGSSSLECLVEVRWDDMNGRHYSTLDKDRFKRPEFNQNVLTKFIIINKFL